jgi:hypothetical protein
LDPSAVSERSVKFKECELAPKHFRKPFTPNTFFDGNNDVTKPTTKRPPYIEEKEWNCISIASSEMFIIDTSDPYFGYSYPEPEPEKNPFNCPVPCTILTGTPCRSIEENWSMLC